ncbi:hypothetical protein BGLA2_700052 [Burkholderia gladioli]|nr:hypothetical protein BGLA2_700052 [Burkholderia gladioli]
MADTQKSQSSTEALADKAFVGSQNEPRKNFDGRHPDRSGL